jgi:PTS system mannose-specific IIA component
MTNGRWLAGPEPGAGGGGQAPEVGVVVVTHGCVCGDLVSAAEAIVGSLPDVVSVPTDAAEQAPVIQRRVAEAVAAADCGGGVLILTDLHGSTPANACIAQLERHDVEVLFGINLPMLIKLSTCDRRSLRPQQLGELLRDTGRRSIRLGSEMVTSQAPTR